MRTPVFAFALSLTSLTACRHPGLPPMEAVEDPSRAASDGGRAEGKFVPAPNPFTSSAFEGETMSGGGHEGHEGHGGHGGHAGHAGHGGGR